MASEEKKVFVERKFSAITPKYDLLNSLLSLNIDRYWRWLAVRELDNLSTGPVLDLCAGTLPSSRAVAERKAGNYVLALDLCRDMLAYGRSRLNGDKLASHILVTCADGEEIPCRNNTFSGVTVAFGVRNLSNLDKGLKEMHRVLMPGGKVVILEFSRPTNFVVRPLYSFYLTRILPLLGGWVSGDEEAYRYLASSIQLFCSQRELAKKMEDAGYANISWKPVTAGIVTIYTGQKPRP